MKKSFIAGFIAVTCAIACVMAEVDLHAVCIPSATINPSISTYDFGSVVEKESKTLLLTATNTAGCSVSSFSWALAGADAMQYNIIDDTCTLQSIASGGTCSATVQFIPDTTGYFDKAQISLTISGDPDKTINLFGTGITAEEAALRTAASLMLGQSDSSSDGCNATASTGIAGKNSSTASALGLAALLGMVMGTVALRRRRRKK